MKTARRVFKEYLKWRKNWDDLCSRCGLCCYARSVTPGGRVIIDFNAPCEHFDKKTNLCLVFKNRFKKCDHCGKVDLFCALFNRSLPPDCSYYKTFRSLIQK